MEFDTIFALASASGRAGVSVVRLSGPDATKALNVLINKDISPRKAHYCGLFADGERIDDAIVLFFKGPHSFTGEDCVELHVHGSVAVLNRLYTVLRKMGLRLAEAGEFSKRALFNQKLDLTQIEAIADLVDAESEAQRKQALTQLDGGLSAQYQGWYSALLDLLARLEVFIDFPDEDLPESLRDDILGRLKAIHAELLQALDRSETGRKVRDGYRIVIMGAPNAGKSSLFNALLKSDAAIVTAQAGTTRDVLEARLRLKNHLVWLYDTAGLRETSDLIEAQGVERAKKAATNADLRVWVIDQNNPDLVDFKPDDADWVIFNKADLPAHNLTHDLNKLKSRVFAVSAQDLHGLDGLITALETHVENALSQQGFPAATQERHQGLLRAAIDHLADAIVRDLSMPELNAEQVRSALRCFDALFGRYDVEDVLDRIFSGFCIGK